MSSKVESDHATPFLSGPSLAVPTEQPVTFQAPRVRRSDPQAAAVPKEYEIINEPPKEKKRGWWNRLLDQ
jgi:hypothetical protein